MKKTIPESEMVFGEFDESNLFHIEKSQMYEELGLGIKTVEFVLKYNDNAVMFLEAKKSCPNGKNKDETVKKQEKFEEYYTSVTEKFMSSLHIYLAALMDKYQDISEIGENLRNVTSMKEIQLQFVLVIKNAEDIAWLAGPMAELNARLLPVRKIWGAKVKVLNEELARNCGLII